MKSIVLSRTLVIAIIAMLALVVPTVADQPVDFDTVFNAGTWDHTTDLETFNTTDIQAVPDLFEFPLFEDDGYFDLASENVTANATGQYDHYYSLVMEGDVETEEYLDYIDFMIYYELPVVLENGTIVTTNHTVHRNTTSYEYLSVETTDDFVNSTYLFYSVVVRNQTHVTTWTNNSVVVHTVTLYDETETPYEDSYENSVEIVPEPEEDISLYTYYPENMTYWTPDAHGDVLDADGNFVANKPYIDLTDMSVLYDPEFELLYIDMWVAADISGASEEYDDNGGLDPNNLDMLLPSYSIMVGNLSEMMMIIYFPPGGVMGPNGIIAFYQMDMASFDPDDPSTAIDADSIKWNFEAGSNQTEFGDGYMRGKNIHLELDVNAFGSTNMTVIGMTSVIHASETESSVSYQDQIADIYLTLIWDQSDDDADGHRNMVDAFPSDPLEWVDTDEDGYGDNSDWAPTDETEWMDTDDDGVGDNTDVFDSDPTETMDTDGDGVGDNSDDFVDDPSMAVDTDGDGYPDAWLSGLTGSAMDQDLYTDAFPADPAASVDTDDDGYPDAWNTGKTAADSTSSLVLDEYPTDPLKHTDDVVDDETPDDDDDTIVPDIPVVELGVTIPSEITADFLVIGTALADANMTLSRVEVRVDGGSWVTANNLEDWSYNLDYDTLPEGTYMVEVRAYDGTAYSETLSFNVTVTKEVVDDLVDDDSDTATPGMELLAVAGAFMVVMAIRRKDE